jgi:nucleotide-binding universal stress UspA family protein
MESTAFVSVLQVDSNENASVTAPKSRLKERLLGSTTSRVASQIKRPMLVAK